jgi:hypothetical protein
MTNFSFIFEVNQTILPNGSRCASQPCQNGGICFDFPSADAFLCACPYPYEGVHCHLRRQSCSPNVCGPTDFGRMLPRCIRFPSDRALRYFCHCYANDDISYYTPYDCGKGERYYIDCDEKGLRVGAVPFTNKAYFVCLDYFNIPVIQSCRLGHVWNDTQKECIPE